MLFTIELNILEIKKNIMYNFSKSYRKIKLGSYDSLPVEKIWTLHNVIIFIKSVLNKD